MFSPYNGAQRRREPRAIDKSEEIRVRILRSSYYTYLTYEQFYWQNLANCKRQDTKHCGQW